jgi:hypothetical protein
MLWHGVVEEKSCLLITVLEWRKSFLRQLAGVKRLRLVRDSLQIGIY